MEGRIAGVFAFLLFQLSELRWEYFVKIDTPLITVTICTYNGEAYLEKTINSVLAQDYANFEVVIVDDGSSDGTVSMIERFAGQHTCIRPFYRKNHGLPASRNFSFKQAEGEWIAIIDQDDLCYPNRLSRQLEVAHDYPSAGLVFCNTHHINEHDEIIGDQLSKFSLPDSFIPKGDAANLLLSKGCFIDSESWFIKREVVERVGALDESLRYACDYEYFIRVGFEADFAYSTDTLAAWRIHSSQATKTFRNIRNEVRSVYWRNFAGKGLTLVTRMVLLKNLCRSFVGDILDRVRG